MNHHRKRRIRQFEQLEPRIVLDSTVVFSEIMYNPPGGDESLEWIELHNQMAVKMDISGWTIDDGVDFTIPDEKRRMVKRMTIRKAKLFRKFRRRNTTGTST